VIRGGRFDATGTDGAALGAGRALYGTSRVGLLVIYSARITARGSEGAAIGAGSADTGQSVVENLTIVDGVISAIGDRASGIGAGFSDAGLSSVSSLGVFGGVLNVFGGVGSTAIGSARTSGGNSTVGNIAITGGFLNVTAGDSPFAIGGQVKSVALGPSAHEVSIDCYAGRTCITGSAVTVTQVSIAALTNTTTIWGTPSSFTNASVFAQYRGLSEPELVHGIVLLHFRTIVIQGKAVVLSFKKGTIVRNASYVASSMHGFALSLPSPGTYEIEVTSDGRNIGQLCIGNQKSFSLVDGDNYFSNVTVCPHAATPDNGGGGDKHTIGPAIIAVIAVITACVIGLVVVCVVILRRKRRADANAHPLILDSGTGPFTA
jgi:hypothetical protein